MSDLVHSRAAGLAARATYPGPAALIPVVGGWLAQFTTEGWGAHIPQSPVS